VLTVRTVARLDSVLARDLFAGSKPGLSLRDAQLWPVMKVFLSPRQAHPLTRHWFQSCVRIVMRESVWLSIGKFLIANPGLTLQRLRLSGSRARFGHDESVLALVLAQSLAERRHVNRQVSTPPRSD